MIMVHLDMKDLDALRPWIKAVIIAFNMLLMTIILVLAWFGWYFFDLFILGK